MKALVTGATSGIGKKIAEKHSERGWKLILTGRNEEVLTEMKNRLGNTEIIAADLSERKDVYRVYEFCKERDIDMLVNNAGFGDFGEFYKSDINKQIRMVDLNCTALMHLCHLYLPNMIKQGEGNVLNVDSIAAFILPSVCRSHETLPSAYLLKASE